MNDLKEEKQDLKNGILNISEAKIKVNANEVEGIVSQKEIEVKKCKVNKDIASLAYKKAKKEFDANYIQSGGVGQYTTGPDQIEKGSLYIPLSMGAKIEEFDDFSGFYCSIKIKTQDAWESLIKEKIVINDVLGVSDSNTTVYILKKNFHLLSKNPGITFRKPLMDASSCAWDKARDKLEAIALEELRLMAIGEDTSSLKKNQEEDVLQFEEDLPHASPLLILSWAPSMGINKINLDTTTPNDNYIASYFWWNDLSGLDEIHDSYEHEMRISYRYLTVPIWS